MPASGGFYAKTNQETATAGYKRSGSNRYAKESKEARQFALEKDCREF